MNRYKPSTPRAALGMIAVAMTAITMGALVVLPAELDAVSADGYPLTAATTATTAATSSVEVPREAPPIEFAQSSHCLTHASDLRNAGSSD